jgi:GntR family transcriptional regulator / MocR family aminotransferase
MSLKLSDCTTPRRSALIQLPVTVDGSKAETLQAQIFEQIRQMILEGRLGSGGALPTTRELSHQIGVSRNTAVLAYDRLVAEGYAETRPYVGTFVARDIPDTTFLMETSAAPAGAGNPAGDDEAHEPCSRALRAHQLIDVERRRCLANFWVGRPDARSFPLKAWSRHIRNRLMGAAGALTSYGDAAGLPELRRAIAAHLGPARGIIVEPDQIIVVGGCQEGFNLVARLLAAPGSVAVVEAPCYQGAAYVFQSFGAALHPVPVDEEGLDTSKLPKTRGAIAYVTPSHQYPTGVTMSLQRRIELLAWASEHDAYIIEDDYDSDFRFVGAPLTALKGLDRNERVIYVGTFSKCMGPGLRLGYLVLPRRLVERARALKTLMNNGQGWLEQAAMADFMSSGEFGRHLRRIRQLYRERRDALIAALTRNFGACEILGEQAGMHLVWRLPRHFPCAAEIERRALAAGVGVCSLASAAALHFEGVDAGDHDLIFGFVALTEREIELGIARLAAVVQDLRRLPAAESTGPTPRSHCGAAVISYTQ